MKDKERGMTTYQEELAKLRKESVTQTKLKEQEMLRLIQVKAEKLANDHLTKHDHTQLSYLSKEEQEAEVALPKGILIDKFITYLKTI